MTIGVYSLQKVLYRGEARSVNVRTAAGDVTILDHHRPLVSLLAPGVMKIVDNADGVQYFPVRSGFLEVRSGNEARLLVEEDTSVS